MLKRKIKDLKIDPDEIFMDSQNIPHFDTYQFEGRIEKSISKKSFLGITFFFVIIELFFLIKLFSLQVIYGQAFNFRSENNRLNKIFILPDRGLIYDRNGEKLAWNGPNSRLYTELDGLNLVLGYIGLPSSKDIQVKKETIFNATIGKDGVEKMYEDILFGAPGVKMIETDSQNNIISESVQELPTNGKNIILTIDSKVQSRFFKIMESVINDSGFEGGAGIIMDVKNGEILALTSYPEYDSKILSRGKPKEKIEEFFNDKNKPFLNRAVSGLYVPGSIIKPLIALGVLNEEIISSEKQIFSGESISLPNPFFPDKKNIFRDWKAHGWVDMKKALAISSDIYFYEVGGGFEDIKGLGIKKIEEYAKKFGFGSKTNIDLEKEETGLVPSPEWKAKNSDDPIWRIGDTYNASIGQGAFQTTPIQIAVYAASVANNGKIIQPHLRLQFNQLSIPIDIPEEYFEIVKQGMRMAVLEGTANALNVPYVEIAAKTGTAEIGISKKRVNSLIIGFFPYKNPRYAFSVVLERGPAENLVGALYVVRQLFDWMNINTPEYLRNKIE
jgi:penicillin-binding protein 2